MPKRTQITVNKSKVVLSDIEQMGWGLRFFVDSELDAYKAAYAYRNNPNGTKVEFAEGAQRWMVTVWSDEAKAMGCDTE